MVSAVTSWPVKSRQRNNARAAMLSLSPSAARKLVWPITVDVAEAKADTTDSGERLAAASNDLRSVLPSIATTLSIGLPVRR